MKWLRPLAFYTPTFLSNFNLVNFLEHGIVDLFDLLPKIRTKVYMTSANENRSCDVEVDTSEAMTIGALKYITWHALSSLNVYSSRAYLTSTID